MPNNWKLSLGGVWLISALSAVILPIFLPSSIGTGVVGNAIAVSAVVMFILSFPSSVIAVPLIFLIDALLGLTTSSIAVAYMNLIMLFAVGLFQWFWMVPRLVERQTFSEVGSEAFLQELRLGELSGNPRLFSREPETYGAWVNEEGATPVERVLKED